LVDKVLESAESFQVRAVLGGPTPQERVLQARIANVDKAALTMRGPASVREGSSTGFYRVSLQKAALGQGQRLQITLGLGGKGGASLSQDYVPLSAADVQLPPGLTIANSRQQANGGLVLQLVNERS
jgi:hypothetical protein